MKSVLINFMLTVTLTQLFNISFVHGNSIDEANQAAERLEASFENSKQVADKIGSSAVVAQIDNSKKVIDETEIPVQLDNIKKAEVGESSFFKLLLAFGVLGVMGCAFYFFIKKYAQKAGKSSQATQIKVLSQHYLGPKKSLAIIRVAGESVLIGITDQNINMIKSLSLLDEDIPEEVPKNFGNIFEKTQRNFVKRSQENEISDDDFAISGIKDFVSNRLKNMRSIE